MLIVITIHADVLGRSAPRLAQHDDVSQLRSNLCGGVALISVLIIGSHSRLWTEAKTLNPRLRLVSRLCVYSLVEIASKYTDYEAVGSRHAIHREPAPFVWCDAVLIVCVAYRLVLLQAYPYLSSRSVTTPATACSASSTSSTSCSHNLLPLTSLRPATGPYFLL